MNLIGQTATRAGRTVRCVLDRRQYPKEVQVSDEQMQTIRLKPDPFHGEWNYAVRAG